MSLPALVLCSCGDVDSSDSPAAGSGGAAGKPAVQGPAYVEDVYRSRPGVQIPFPVDLPSGFQFYGFSMTQTDNGMVTARDADLVSESAFVTICAEVATGSRCPAATTIPPRMVGDIKVTILSTDSTQATIDFWRDVDMTTDIDRLSWL